MLQAHQIHRAFGAQDVLRGVSFRISRGEKVGLIGRNGCGKRTLFAILTGRDRADRGSIALTEPGTHPRRSTPGPEYPPGARLHDVIFELGR